MSNADEPIAGAGDLPGFEHLVLTRFNVRFRDQSKRPSEAWLRERFDLFKKYCVTSFRQQSSPDFRWLIFLDKDTPEWLRDAMEQEGVGLFDVVYLDQWDDAVVAALVSERVASQYLVSTRVDNDDAVATAFIAEIQSLFAAQELCVITLLKGVQLENSKVYRRSYVGNPFASLIERRSDLGGFRTVYSGMHEDLVRDNPSLSVPTSGPMWMQVIHGDNFGNTRVGLRVRSRYARESFPHIALADDENRVAVLADQVRTGAAIAAKLLAKPTLLVDLLRADFVARLALLRSATSGARIAPRR